MSAPVTIPATVLARADADPSAVVIRRRRRGAWHPTTAGELAAMIRAVATGLQRRGIRPGGPVGTCGHEHPDGVAFDLAVQHAGAWALALPPVLSAPEVAATLTSHGATIAFCGDGELATQLSELAPEDRGTLELIVVPDGTVVVPGGVTTLRLGELSAVPDAPGAGGDAGADGDARAFAGHSAGEHARVVAWRHRDVLAAVAALDAAGVPGKRAEVLCHVPFAHPASRIIGLYATLMGGGALTFPESHDTLVRDMAERSPTVVLTTPRLPEVLLARHQVRLAQTRGLRGWIARNALRSLAARPRAGRVRRAAAMWVAGRWVRRQAGLARTRRILTLLEPLGDDVVQFWRSLGVEVLAPYGVAEMGPLTYGPGGCGAPLPGVELRTDPDGRLEARSPWTAEAVDAAAWHATGDKCVVDPDGALVLRDGAVAIESSLRASPYIARAVVLEAADGTRRVAVEAEPDTLAVWAQLADVPHAGHRALLERPETRELLRSEAAAHGGPAEGVDVLPRPLELARGELTWLGSARRSAVAGAVEPLTRDQTPGRAGP